MKPASRERKDALTPPLRAGSTDHRYYTRSEVTYDSSLLRSAYALGFCVGDAHVAPERTRCIIARSTRVCF
jgi:hypothetical protein